MLAKTPGAEPPPPKAPASEMALALSIAVLLDAVGTAKCALMSVKYDRGVSAGWRAWSARAESSLGFSDGVDASQRPARLPGLQPGWLFGRQMDLSDAQWRGFRTSFPTLFGVALVTAPLVAVARRALGPNAMPAFHAAYGAAAAAYLHGARSVWIVSITCAHYCVCVTFAGRPKIGLAAVWTSALAALAAAQFAAPDWSFARLGGDALAPLDARALQGVLPRWWVHFNLLVLRLISFGADLHRRRLETRDSGVVRDSETKASRNAKERLFGKKRSESALGAAPAAAEHDARDARACSVSRTTNPATGGVEDSLREEGDDANERRHGQPALESPAAYSFFEYFAYCLYPPLYLAGPTCVFHKFAPQLYRAQTTHSRRAVARYALVKFALVFLLLEVWTHLVYTNAMALGRVWTRGATFGPFEVGATSLATLNFMYLKFTVMWRFFRAWALASGVEAPENMLRCVNNNATILGFWKGWHASYNKWLVRYVYVPLGGAKYRLLNVWAVFFFVAAWHDKMNRRLLGWSVIFAAFLAPELLVGAIGRKAFPTVESRDSVVFRCLRSFAGAVNVHVLIAGNMVGYVVGLDGLDELARAYFSRGTRDALEFLAWSLLTFAAAAHVGFEQRAGEMRVKARTHATAGKAAKRS